MLYIGNHVSISDGYPSMVTHEQKLGGNTFAFFTRNPRGGRSKAVTDEELQQFFPLHQDAHFGPLVAHAAYTMNLCAQAEKTRSNGLDMLEQDLTLMRRLPSHFYNFHPGSHVGQGIETGIRLIADALCHVLSNMCKNEETSSVISSLSGRILLETMAGKGSEVGSRFEELQAIIELTEQAFPGIDLGVCLDTCHVWDGGYDIQNAPDDVLKEFDQVVGLHRLRAVHLNDSKNPLAAHKDRHEKLGEGEIGLEALLYLTAHPMLDGRPFILETPNEDDGYAREITLVKDHH